MAEPLKIRVDKAVASLLKLADQRETLIGAFQSIDVDASRLIDRAIDPGPLDIALDLLGVWQDNTEMFDLVGVTDETWPAGCFCRDYLYREFHEKVGNGEDIDKDIERYIRECRDVVRRYTEDS